MLTRVFWLLEEQIRYSLKPLLNLYLFPISSAFAGLDYRLRRATLYPAELWVQAEPVFRRSRGAVQPGLPDAGHRRAGPWLFMVTEIPDDLT